MFGSNEIITENHDFSFMVELPAGYVGFTAVGSLISLVYGREIELQGVVRGSFYVYPEKDKK